MLLQLILLSLIPVAVSSQHVNLQSDADDQNSHLEKLVNQLVELKMEKILDANNEKIFAQMHKQNESIKQVEVKVER